MPIVQCVGPIGPMALWHGPMALWPYGTKPWQLFYWRRDAEPSATKVPSDLEG